MSRNTTWTLGREAGLGVSFVGTLYYDGQGFMVPHDSGVAKIADLNGATICVEKGTTHEATLADYFQTHGMTYRPLVIESVAEVAHAFFAGRCLAYTSDRSQLTAVRLQAPTGAAAYDILPDQISTEPLAPAVRRGDEEWVTLVRWTLFALLAAEKYGLTRENVRTKISTESDPVLQRFLANGGYGKALRTNPDWAVRVIESVANYGEMFERNLGGQSPLRIERGLNRLRTTS